MWNWITLYGGTVVIALVLAAVLGGILFSLIRNRKKGKTNCGCGCEACAMKGDCHK